MIQCLWDGLAASSRFGDLDSFVEPRRVARAGCGAGARAGERESLPLYGVPFAVKDNINVAGYPTTAGCPAYRYVAERSAPVVARLIEAGAIFVGKTNMDQFSTGLAGDRSPYGIAVQSLRFQPDIGRIEFGIGGGGRARIGRLRAWHDTAGSGRVPAGLQQHRGLEADARPIEHEGIVPACRSLDCVAIFATTAADAWTVFNVARDCVGSPLDLDGTGLDDSIDSDGAMAAIPFRFAVPRSEQLEFFGDDSAAQEAFATAVERLESLGGIRTTIDFRPLQEVAALLYKGPWLAERLAVLGDFLRDHPADIYPATRTVIEAGSRYSAAEYFKASYRLAALRPVCQSIFDSADMLVVPTMPTLPTLAAVQADSIAWSRRLGYYTNFVNLLGLSAIAIPAGIHAGRTPARHHADCSRRAKKWNCATSATAGSERPACRSARRAIICPAPPATPPAKPWPCA